MIGCDNTVTVIHHIKGEDGDEYACSVFEKASWFKKLTITTSGDGAKPVNTYESRILGSHAMEVAPGDFVALGVVESMETQSDLNGIDHFRITAVGDNRRGGLPHWRLSGQ